ncbi:MAG: hypothetical protein ACK4NC_07165 [Candidatus Gracilibacteria bacterium]
MNGKLSDVLTNLVIAEFSSVDEGIVELSKRTGLGAEKILSFLKGEAMPQKFEAAKLAKSLAVLKDDSKASFGFLQLCNQSTAEFSAATVEAPVSIQEHETKETTDTNSELEELRRQVEEYKKALEAKEEELRYKQEMNQIIDSLQKKASDGVNSGWLPPALYKDMFDGLNEAKFSSMCTEKEIDPYVEAYAISYVLSLFEKFGQNSSALFSSSDSEPLENKQMTDEQLIEQQAMLNFKLYKANGNFSSLTTEE